MRRTFADELYKRMEENENIYLLVGDLGYKVFDNHFATWPERCINTGAAEQALLDIAVGLALTGKIPFVYTITPFFFRGFETIRTYIDHESIPVHLVGSGRDADYQHDGFSHDASDIRKFLNHFSNIKQYFPEDKTEIPLLVEKMVNSNNPSFISLRR